MLDTYGPSCEYGNTIKLLACLMHLLKKLHREHSINKEKKNGIHGGLASTLGSSAVHRCPTRVENSGWKVERRTKVRERHEVIHYCTTFGANRKGGRAE